MRVIAFDFETSGLASRVDNNTTVWCVGFSERLRNGEYKTWCAKWSDAKQQLKLYADDSDVLLVCHNASFDVSVARQQGVNVSRYADTALMAYVLSPGESVGLNELAYVYFELSKVDIKEVLVKECGFSPNVSKEELFAFDYSTNEDAMYYLREYCAYDAELCCKLYWQQLEVYERHPELLRPLQLEMDYCEVVMDMERTGMCINREHLASLDETIRTQLDRTESDIKALVHYAPGETKEYKNGFSKNRNHAEKYYSTSVENVYSSSVSNMVYNHCQLEPFNPNSGDDIAWLLKSHGWKPEEMTKAGKPKTDKDTLELLKADYPVLEPILEWRMLEKLNNTFVSTLEKLSREDNFVRCSYNQCVTRTTRLSASNPNLQNISVRTELGKKVREAVVAPTGYSLIVADLAQIELRVLAYLLREAGDDRMADAVRSGLDLHQFNADTCGMSRTFAKTFIFLIVYGGGARLAASKLKITIDDAQAAIDGLHKRMPTLQNLIDNSIKRAKKNNCWVKLLYGHRIHYPDLKNGNDDLRARAERQVFNALIQGTAASINKLLMIEARDVLSKFNGVMSFAVHDEAGAYIPTGLVDEVLPKLNHVYRRNDILDGVPVDGDWAKGSNWNEAKANGG